MPRPTNKEQLLRVADETFNELFILIKSMAEDELTQDFSIEGRDRNVRDVLVHLYEWHRLLLHWIRLNHSGVRINFLPDPYTWKTYPQMNIAFWQKHQITSLNEAIRLLKDSHAEALTLIGTYSNEQLFTPKYFPWTGTTSLGSYCVSSTSSHYDWAIKKLKKNKKHYSLSTKDLEKK